MPAIRNIPEPVYQRFAAVARKSDRNAEAHGRFLIERETEQTPLETCGGMPDAYAELPPRTWRSNPVKTTWPVAPAGPGAHDC
jgi:hypothetical protein